MIVLSDVPNILASIPAYAVNNNCVQDQCWRVRELYDLAMRSSNSTDPAPMYLLIALNGLQSWIDHAKSQLPK